VADQSWSNGKVGMYGKSWGGFNGLQVAYEQPPALKAVISLYSTDNRSVLCVFKCLRKLMSFSFIGPK
jgi:predicted acyl esterase